LFLHRTIYFFFGLIINLRVRYTWRNAKPDRPFSTGPYRYSRHLIYISFILIYIIIAIMNYIWIFLVIMILYILHLLPVVTTEERYCLKIYGKEYQDYMERTPRWIRFPETRR
jgi:protein-S-isoprenylcysteine O-methyltransferase Ste14